MEWRKPNYPSGPLPGWEDPVTKERVEVYKAKDIREYANEFFYRSLKLWSDFEKFQILPHGKGTMHERETTLQIIKALSAAQNEYDQWEREKQMAEARAGRGK